VVVTDSVDFAGGHPDNHLRGDHFEYFRSETSGLTHPVELRSGFWLDGAHNSLADYVALMKRRAVYPTLDIKWGPLLLEAGLWYKARR